MNSKLSHMYYFLRSSNSVMNSYSAMADMYYIGKSDRECMQNALCVEMKAAPLALMLVKSYHMLHNTDIFAPRYRKKKFPPM